jgi:GAF domain-containing protein
LSDLFGRVVTLTKERLGYYHTQLLRYDPRRDAVVLIDGYGETGKKMLAEGYKLLMGSSLIGTAAASGETVLRPTLAENPDWQPNPLLPDTQGEIAVPIKFQDKVLGVLDVQSNQAGALTDDDRLLLEGLCGQIAITIENVRLSEQSRTTLREVDALNRRLTGEGWENYLERRSSQQVIWVGDHEALAPAALNAADEQLSGGQIVIDPVAGDEQQATVSVPLMLRGQAIGALRVAMPQAAYTDELHNTLDSIAGHVAQAAENARLIEQTQHTAQREKQIAQAADKIHRASNLDGILRTAIEEVSRIVGAEDVGIQLGVDSRRVSVAEVAPVSAGVVAPNEQSHSGNGGQHAQQPGHTP